jgi:ribulose-5-phosphate 4-epimerase/fuculose-1-phosphate aldolase
MSFELRAKRRASDAPISDAERAMRVDLAAAYRLVGLAGWDDLIYSHISAMVPDEPGHFLINPFGLTFDEVTASNLVKINAAAEIIGDSPHSVNVTGFALHAALHAARPDAVCVLHLHETSAIAVSAQAAGLLPLSQHALRFEGELAYHDYEGLAFSPSEGESLVRALGTKTAMLLRNHGPVVLGRTIAEAYVRAATLIKACRIQNAAQSGNATLHQPGDAVITLAAEQLRDGGAIEGVAEWPALLRRLDRICPDFRS